MKYRLKNGTIEEVIKAYYTQSHKTGRSPKRNHGNTVSIFFEEDVLYSYGYHFILAIRTKQGKYIVSGDRCSDSTFKQQNQVFQTIPNQERCEIPFSALSPMMYVCCREDFIIAVKDIELLDTAQDEYIDTGRKNKSGGTVYEHTLGASLFKQKDRYFLSAFDETGKPGRNYFLTELQTNGKPILNIKDAYKSLKPEAVKYIISKGREKDVKRQGEWFFIKVENQEYCKTRNSEKGYVLYDAPNHKATEGFCIKNLFGNMEQYVRGVIRHTGGDHRMVKLYEEGTKVKDRKWYKALHNVQIQSRSAYGRVD